MHSFTHLINNLTLPESYNSILLIKYLAVRFNYLNIHVIDIYSLKKCRCDIFHWNQNWPNGSVPLFRLCNGPALLSHEGQVSKTQYRREVERGERKWLWCERVCWCKNGEKYSSEIEKDKVDNSEC